MAAERLQKLLARAGFGSRRACEELITAGRVSVDGRIVAELGAKADLQTQDIRLDGSRLKPERPEYWLLNKPKDVICTNFDPSGRKRPMDIMQRYTKARLFPVGRLDTDTKGLLLMTNDGPLTNSLTHPRYEVPKTYVATVVGDLTPESMRRLRRGVWLAEGRTRPAQVRVISHGRSKSIVEITIREGRNRQVRRMLARLEHNVRELVRTRIGRITLRGLSVGEARRLEPDEVEYLKQLPEMPPEAAPAFDRGRSGPPRGPRPFKERGPGAEHGRERGPRRFDKRGPGDERGRDRGPPRFDKVGPRRFDQTGPRRFDKRRPRPEQGRPVESSLAEPPHPFAGRPDRGPRPFKQRGPGAEHGRDRGPRRFDKRGLGDERGRDRGPRRFDKRGPGDERGRDRGPPRFDKAGPRRFDKTGPRRFEDRRPRPEQGRPAESSSGEPPHPFAGRPERGPRPFRQRGTGEDRGRDRGPPRFDKAGPRRKDPGKFNRDSKSERPYQPRDSHGEKRSRRPHDTDGTRKEGEGFRRHEGRGGRRGRGRPDRPPFGGRRPDRRPPQ